MIERRRNAAEYITSRCAVKNIQKENKGIDKIKDIIPAHADQFGFFLKIRKRSISKKIKS